MDDVLTGAEAVVDVTNSPSLESQAVQKFFETSSRNIIAAEVKAGVRYHVVLSIVGTEHMQESGYFRGKLAQEKLARASPIPFTILRSTQFFEFLRGIANSATLEQTVYLSPALFQLIAADDAVAALADVVMEPPHLGTVEVAGPERVGMAELVGRYLVVPDVTVRYFGALLNDGALTPSGNPRVGSKHFDQWLSESKQKAQPVA